MKRKLVTAGIILVCFLLNSSIFSYLKIGQITPNIMVVVTASFGFMRGKKEGLLVGFFSGLLIDFYSGGILGSYALLYSILGYLNGLFQRLFYDEDIKLPLALIASSELIYGLAVFIFSFVMRSRFHFGNYLIGIIIPELLYTVLITFFLYPVILMINRQLEEKEKRSASKFV